tara:strand:+ start:66 stop:905 length:840 start_codon:yes stop_codon:yes gene_type:complete
MTHIDYEMSNEDYHNTELHPHFSSSDIKEVVKNSPLHWVIKQELPKKEPTPAMQLGSAVHAFILEPNKGEFVRGEGSARTKDFKKQKEELAKEGKTLLPEATFDDALRIATKAMETNAYLVKLLKDKRFVAEASVFTECSETKLDIRCRPDGMIMPDDKGKGGIIFDIKTTNNIHPSTFFKDVKSWSYDVQAAFYLHTCAAAKIPIEKFIFFAVCKETGICQAHVLSELYLAHARQRMLKAMSDLLDSQVSGRFTTGWEMENTIHLPQYLQEATEEQPF